MCCTDSTTTARSPPKPWENVSTLAPAGHARWSLNSGLDSRAAYTAMTGPPFPAASGLSARRGASNENGFRYDLG